LFFLLKQGGEGRGGLQMHQTHFTHTRNIMHTKHWPTTTYKLKLRCHYERW